MDLVVENLAGAPMILEARPERSHHWIGLALDGKGNRLALNARVRVTTGKLQQMGEVRSGGSYLSQNDLALHFGLGAAAAIDRLEVMWPGAARPQVFTGVKVDQFYRLRQDGVLVAEASSGRRK